MAKTEKTTINKMVVNDGLAKSQLEMTKLKPAEKKRTYHFIDGTKLEVDNVTHFQNRPVYPDSGMYDFGYHRLQTADGKCHIVFNTGWKHIEIDVPQFTL